MDKESVSSRSGFSVLLVIPLGAVMFIKEHLWLKSPVADAVTSTVGSIVGMIPEGLYLLTSLALVASVIRLANRRTLVHDMGCIETLARVDTLCVDKTGTITAGEPRVTDILPASGVSEEALMRAGIEVRHIAMGRNVPMYKTNIMTKPCGPFSGPTVCSMRPMTREQAELAYKITAAMPNVHGAPVHIGDPKDIGIADIMRPDYGDSVEIREGEVCVFWPCGVTPQAAIENAKPPIVITHSPGHMFITDILNSELNDFLEAHKGE